MQTGTWLKSVRAQETDEGVDHHDLVCDPHKLTVRTREQLLRVVLRANQALALVPLPMEADELQRNMWENNRAAYVRELGSCAAALAAALTAVACTDQEIAKLAPVAAEETTSGSGVATLVKSTTHCRVCKTEVKDAPHLSRISPTGVIVCDNEDCEERYDGTETMQLNVQNALVTAPKDSV